jgi:hypothetical protein
MTDEKDDSGKVVNLGQRRFERLLDDTQAKIGAIMDGSNISVLIARSRLRVPCSSTPISRE